MSLLDYMVMVLYLLVVIGIGLFASRKVKTMYDFALGGKTLNPLIIIASSAATAAGAGTCLGQAGKAYNDGISAFWLVIAWVFGMAVLGLMAKTIYNTNATSLSDVFRVKHNETTAKVSGIYTLIYSMGMLIAQMVGMGMMLKLLLSGVGISYEVAVMIGGAITILYTFQGGFFAVAYTDAAQFGILFVSMVIIFPIVVFFGVANAGVEAVESVMTEGTFNIFNPKTLSFTALIAIVFKYTFSACTGIPYIQRILASKNAKAARKSQLMASLAYLILGGVVMIASIYARVLFPELVNPDTIVLKSIMELFPTVLAGFAIAGFIAAVMSSVDSYLLVASQIFTDDVCTLVVPEIKEENKLKYVK